MYVSNCWQEFILIHSPSYCADVWICGNSGFGNPWISLENCILSTPHWQMPNDNELPSQWEEEHWSLGLSTRGVGLFSTEWRPRPARGVGKGHWPEAEATLEANNLSATVVDFESRLMQGTEQEPIDNNVFDTRANKVYRPLHFLQTWLGGCSKENSLISFYHL